MTEVAGPPFLISKTDMKTLKEILKLFSKDIEKQKKPKTRILGKGKKLAS